MTHPNRVYLFKMILLSVLLVNLTVRLYAHQETGPVVLTEFPNFFDDKVYRSPLKEKKEYITSMLEGQTFTKPIKVLPVTLNETFHTSPSPFIDKPQYPLTILVRHPFAFWWSASVSTLTKIGVLFCSIIGLYASRGVARKLVCYIKRKVQDFICTIIYTIAIIFLLSLICPFLMDIIRHITTNWYYIELPYHFLSQYIIRHISTTPVVLITAIISYIIHGKASSLAGLMWDWLSMEASASVNPENHGGQPGHLPSPTTVPTINAVSTTTLQEDIRTHFEAECPECGARKNKENGVEGIRPMTIEEIVGEEVKNALADFNITLKALVEKNMDKLRNNMAFSVHHTLPKQSMISRIDTAIKSTEVDKKIQDNKTKGFQRRKQQRKDVSFEKHPNSGCFRKASTSSDSSTVSLSSIEAPLAAAMLWKEDEDELDIDLVIPAVDPNIEIQEIKKLPKISQPIKSTTEEEQLIKELAGDQVALNNFLKERRKARIEERKKAALLTEEQKRSQPEELKIELIKKSHYQTHAPLDDQALTPEEQKMTWPQLLRVLREKSRSQWVEREHRMTGKPKFRCDKCQNITVEGHHCWQANWGRGETKKGVPTERKMTISQSRPGQLRMSHMDYVDVPRMQQQYKAIRDVRAQMAEKLQEDQAKNRQENIQLISNDQPQNNLTVNREESDYNMGGFQPGQPSLIDYHNFNEVSTDTQNKEDKSITDHLEYNPLIGATYPASPKWRRPSQNHHMNRNNYRNTQSQNFTNNHKSQTWVAPKSMVRNNELDTFIGKDGKQYVNVMMKNGACRPIPMPNNLGSQSD